MGYTMDIKKNDDIKLNIESMTSEGSAVGHYNGLAVFVRGAVPDDEIIAHIIKRSKSYAIGIIKDIVSPSPSRIVSDCPVSEKCGGCSFRNMTYVEELKHKKQRVIDAVQRIAHLDIVINDVVGADEIDHYRNKAQYPVAICDGELFAGFYAYKSHRIIPCADCRLQSEIFKNLLIVFSDWAQRSGVSSYDESSGKGLLRHIYLRRAFATGEIMACAVINGSSLPMQEYLVDGLRKIDGVKSICININRQRNNVVLGDETVTLWGSDTITDELLGNKFVISPSSFYQVNHDQCERLYSKTIEYAGLTGSETVIDLYCGAGTIGLSLADRAGQVFGIEIVPQAIENAKVNAKINNITNAEFFCGDAYDGAAELEKRGIKPDVVILDPPRKGCRRELIDVIEKMNPSRVVYVSCDSATLARDLQIFNEKSYKVMEITPVDMFPRTPHIECVALITKA